MREELLDSIKVERQDFMLALEEVIPAFGAATEEVCLFFYYRVLKPTLSVSDYDALGGILIAGLICAKWHCQVGPIGRPCA